MDNETRIKELEDKIKAQRETMKQELDRYFAAKKKPKDYTLIVSENIDKMPRIVLETKKQLDELDADLRFRMEVDDEDNGKTLTIFIAIQDNIAYFVYPEGFMDEEQEAEETPEQYFKRKKANFKELDKIAKQIAKMPEWSRCKNKSQRDMVVDKFLVDTENKDFYNHDMERIADYVKIFVEGGVSD